MQLLLIRHGQSEADLLDVHEGRADFPLTTLGREQAEKMAAYVAEKLIPDIILASPLLRARQTADILQQKINCDIQFWDDLMEFNNGVLAGMDRKEAAEKYPLPPEGRPIHIPIEKGESELEFRQRVEFMYSKIIHEYKDVKRVAIVSHGGFISNFLKVFYKQHSDAFVYPTGDTGMHLLEIRPNNNITFFLNNQSHL